MEAIDQSKTTEWWVLIGDQESGPHSYLEMIRMLQNGELFDYNYIWSGHLEAWTPLAKVEDFSKDRLLRLLQHDKEIAQAFKPRKSPRVSRKIEIFGHNDERFFTGHTIDLGVNGALVFLEDPLIQPGHRLTLHFRSSQTMQNSFNVTAEVLRKNFSEKKLTIRSGLHYAVKFVQVQPQGLELLNGWVDSAEKAKK